MKTILIVEDNEKNMKLVRDILRHKQYTTLEAVNGLDGVRIARESRPDLVLMDIQLPDIDGIEALRRIREEASLDRVPVIAVSASCCKPLSGARRTFPSSTTTFPPGSKRAPAKATPITCRTSPASASCRRTTKR